MNAWVGFHFNIVFNRRDFYIKVFVRWVLSVAVFFYSSSFGEDSVEDWKPLKAESSGHMDGEQTIFDFFSEQVKAVFRMKIKAFVSFYWIVPFYFCL